MRSEAPFNTFTSSRPFGMFRSDRRGVCPEATSLTEVLVYYGILCDM